MPLVCLANPQLCPSSFFPYDQSANPFSRFSAVIREHFPPHRVSSVCPQPTSEMLVGVGVQKHPKFKNQGGGLGFPKLYMFPPGFQS